MADKKSSAKERLREITAGIEEGIKELFESEKYREYLRTMSRFPNYSVNNTVLIHMQKPDATHVAGYNRWRDEFERHVKRGERGITIIAPTPYKKKIEEQKVDPDTKAPILDENGKAILEEKEISIPMFKPVKVFDVSQTEGKPLPQLASDLTGDVVQYDAFLEALRRASPVPVRFGEMDANMDGYFNYVTQEIVLREGMSQVQTISAAVHEMAHAKLHNYEAERQAAQAGAENGKELKKKDRNTEEVEAESISYTVCQYYGIQTGENSFGYIASWSKGKELQELKASLETINKTAGSMIKAIDAKFQEVCKERGIDLTAKEQAEEAPAAEAETPAPEPLEEKRAKRPAEQIREMLPHLLSWTEVGCSLNGGEQYLAVQSCAEGYDYTFFDEAFQGSCGGLLDRAELPIEEAVELILYDRGMEGVMLEPFAFDELVKKLDRKELGQDAVERAREIIQAVLSESNVPEPVTITGIEVYQNLYGEQTPLHYDVLVGYEGALKEDDASTLLEEENHMAGGRRLRFHPIRPEETGALETYKARLRESYGETAIQIGVPEEIKKLDVYPLPDEDLSEMALEAAGYMYGDLLPLSKERAGEWYDKDFTIYAVAADGNADLLFDKEELNHRTEGTLFGLLKEEWEQSAEFHEKILERQEHQEERERAFLSYGCDCFAIYQRKDMAGRFLSWSEMGPGICLQTGKAMT